MEIFKGKKLRINCGYLMCGRKAAHRMIWEHVNGAIPNGFDIHHKDGNKLNNSIENLECISHVDHLSMHMKQNKKLHDWHKTEEGRKFLGEKAKQLWKDRPFHDVTCKWCGNTFKAQQIDRAEFCSGKCMQASRRASGIDLIDRQCVICSKPFKINKFHKTLTCGFKCGSKYRTRFAKGTRKLRVK